MSDSRTSPRVDPVPLPRALRGAEGVIAQYIHELSEQRVDTISEPAGALAEQEPRTAVAARLHPRSPLHGAAVLARRTMCYQVPERLTSGTYGRHGSARSPGQGGKPVGTATPGTTGRIGRDGIARA